MGDIKLFKIGSNGVAELEGRSVAVEKSIQLFIQKMRSQPLGKPPTPDQLKVQEAWLHPRPMPIRR